MTETERSMRQPPPTRIR